MTSDTYEGPVPEIVEAFIQAASAVPPEQWRTLYSRYATDLSIRRAFNRLASHAITVQLRQSASTAIEHRGKRDMTAVRITEKASAN